MWLYLPSQVIIDKPLLHRVKVEESMWSIETGNGCCIYINLEKTKEIMWKSVLEGEQGIDLTKVDTTRNISEFDEEAQAAIQRVTYDHHMKMLGKPTSQEKVRKKSCLLLLQNTTSLMPHPHALFGEESLISWACYQNVVRANEIVRLLITCFARLLRYPSVYYTVTKIHTNPRKST